MKRITILAALVLTACAAQRPLPDTPVKPVGDEPRTTSEPSDQRTPARDGSPTPRQQPPAPAAVSSPVRVDARANTVVRSEAAAPAEGTGAGVPLGTPIAPPAGRVLANVDSAASEHRICVEATIHGEATYYASTLDGRRTASGRIFRNSEPLAAHPSFPFGTRVRVTNLRNERTVELTIEDRGPHGALARARSTIIDVSQSAARRLDFIRQGRTPVTVEVLEWGGPPPAAYSGRSLCGSS